jgi:tRNA(fMet)-specific endonuclease VapC
MKLIVDTSVFIDGLRLRPSGVALISFFETTEHDLYISSVVGFELFSGESSKKPDQQRLMQQMLSFFEVVDMNWSVAKRAGEIYRGGLKHLEFPDYIIAASALAIGAQVVTLNKKHFEKIPGLQIYDMSALLQ